jgi:hypothetical protein
MFTYPFSFIGPAGGPLQSSSTLLLNGTDQYASIDSSGGLGAGVQGVASAWVNLDTLAPSSSRAPFVSKMANTSTGAWDLGYKVDGNLFYFRVFHSSGVTEVVSSISPVVGEWYQVAGRFDETDVYLFVNGVEVASASLGGTIIKSSAGIAVGANATSSPSLFYSGSIAIPLVFLSYKSDSEMLALGTARQPNDYEKSGMQIGIPLNKGVSSGLENQNVISAYGDATLVNSPTYTGEPIVFNSVPQVTGFNTLLLNGGSDFATVADSASLDLTSEFTLSIYVNIADLGSTGTYKLIDKISGTTGFSLEFDETTQKFKSYVYISNVLYEASSTTIPSINTWNHVAAVYDGTSLTIYVNGSSEDVTLVSGSITTNAQDITIDCNGSVALPMIYDAGLNSTRISEISVAKDPSLYNQDDMVMGLPFNDGNTSPNDDTTSNANDATLQGAASYAGEQLDIEQISSASSPSDLPNLQFWMEGDSGFTDLAKSRTITNTGVTILNNAINTHDSFEFNGTTKKMQVPDSSDWDFSSEGFTACFVAKFISTTGWQTLFAHDDGGGDSTNKIILGTTQQIGKLDVHFNGPFTGAFATATSNLDTNYHIYTVRVDSNRDATFFLDDALDGETSGFATQYPSPTSPLVIGWAEGSGSYLNGEIAEFYISSKAESNSDILGIIDTFKTKYNI